MLRRNGLVGVNVSSALIITGTGRGARRVDSTDAEAGGVAEMGSVTATSNSGKPTEKERKAEVENDDGVLRVKY